MNKFTKMFNMRFLGLLLAVGLALPAFGSSHREAPLISNDPLADNTDLYAFMSPDRPGFVTIIANFIPMQLPHGGPNYYTFGENIRYEIRIDNDVTTPGDDVIYRFTFRKQQQDPTTFFNIRLGMEQNKASYNVVRSTDGGQTWARILTQARVPAYNVGPRSIETPGVGLGATSYEELFNDGIYDSNAGEKIFAGPVDDPFFVDLGGIFDLGDAPRQNGASRDGVGCYNVSTIAIQVPVETLQKDGQDLTMADNILDGDYAIGIWARAARRSVRVIRNQTNLTNNPNQDIFFEKQNFVGVSRIGMPLTNEAVIPIGQKDIWNMFDPYNEFPGHYEFFYNPELALYMDDDQFGGAVPAFAPLRIQEASLGAFDFTNGASGLWPLKGSPAVAGTALDDAIFGTLLLPADNKPRSVDLWPIFHTGVPNLAPYHLATGKAGDPLANGKPFINNFLPNGGDMLRLNMAVPATPRNDPDFSSLGLVQAAVLGLTDSRFNGDSLLEFIPNMDGFPNGRRLEDDVTRIELQAVSGVVLAAIGLWYDDYDPMASPPQSPVTSDLLGVLGYTTNVEENDTTFRTSFPYVQLPWSGTSYCSGKVVEAAPMPSISPMQMQSPQAILKSVDGGFGYPNPFVSTTTMSYTVTTPSDITMYVYDAKGSLVETLAQGQQDAGDHEIQWNAAAQKPGTYVFALMADGEFVQSAKLVKSE